MSFSQYLHDDHKIRHKSAEVTIMLMEMTGDGRVMIDMKAELLVLVATVRGETWSTQLPGLALVQGPANK